MNKREYNIVLENKNESDRVEIVVNCKTALGAERIAKKLLKTEYREMKLVEIYPSQFYNPF